MDGGASWVPVSGPMNTNDTRFAVTGRGATVFAGDAAGVVWRTNNGGDGTLSLSVLASVVLTPENSNAPNGCYAVAVCDSAVIPILFEYHACDSIQVASVEFLNDTVHELSWPQTLNTERFFSTRLLDTVRLLYRPTRQENWTVQIRVVLRQPDGYLEDTTIAILLNGTSPKVDPLAFSETTAADSIDFGAVSLCADADHKVTLINTGCSDVTIQTMNTTGPQFTLISSFSPFVLSPGTSRTFLIHYKPSSGTLEHGSLFIRHSNGSDAVQLSGTGFAPNKTVLLQADSVFSSLCDSVSFTVKLRNVACTPFKILAVTTDTPFRAGVLPAIDSLRQGETTDLTFTFSPSAQGTVLDSVHVRVAYEGVTTPYDTTIVIAATGTTGKPDIALSATALNLGSISICSETEDTLFLQGTGCGDVSVSGQFDQQNGFSFVKPPAATVKKGTIDTVIVRFHPGSTLGPQTSNLILTTSAGTKTVVCRVAVTQDPGAVTLGITQSIQSYTCQSAAFIFEIKNTTCDSIEITKFALGGTAQGDFDLTFDTIRLLSGGVIGLNGVFSPQDTLARNATITLTIQRADGSIYDTTIQISGIGIGVPPIKVAVANNRYTAKPYASVFIPVYAVTSSVLQLDTIDFAIRLNTDLLTPLRIVSGKGSFGSANVQKFNVTQDSLDIRLALPNDIDLTIGEICEIECNPYVASKLYTPITMGHVRFDNVSGNTQCFSAQAVDSVASFALDRDCSDTTLAQFLGFNTITLDRIAPNPTHGEVTLDFRVARGYRNDAVLEVYDVMGNKLRAVPLVFSGGEGIQSFTLELRGNDASNTTEAGIRYLRIRTIAGREGISPLVCKVILWK